MTPGARAVRFWCTVYHVFSSSCKYAIQSVKINWFITGYCLRLSTATQSWPNPRLPTLRLIFDDIVMIVVSLSTLFN